MMLNGALHELRRYRFRVFLVIFVAFGGFVVWTLFTDLAVGVHIMGKVVPDTRRKVVQPQVSGIVEQVHLKEGQEVKPGDPIIQLETKKLVVEREAMRRRLVALELTRERQNADLSKKSFRPDLETYRKKYPEIDLPGLLLMAQTTAIATTASFSAQIESIDARLNRLAAQVESDQRAIELITRQMELSKSRFQKLVPIAEQGLYPRSDVERQEQQYLDLRARLLEKRMSSQSASDERTSLLAERQRVIEENRKKILESASGMDVEIAQLQARLIQIEKDIESTTVRAAVAGQLVGFETTTVGSVVSAGQTIAQIVPLEDPLVVEATINPKDVERVTVGTTAEVRFAALPRKASPLLRGKIVYVSRDAIAPTTEASRSAVQQIPGYQVRVTVEADQLRKLGDFKVLSGMPVEIFTDGGTRSVLDYFVSPVAQLFERAMREY